MNTQLINFTIPKLLLKDFDSLAREKQSNRSELLRNAVRNYLEKEELRTASFKIIKNTAQKINLTDKQAIKLGEEAKSWARRKNANI